MGLVEKINNEKFAIGVIVLFHIIGAIGIKLNPELFLQTSTINLLLSAALVFGFSKLSVKAFFVLISLAVVSFFIEVIGVNTSLPFGSYQYGDNLGPKLLNVPLVIGVNWVMLLYCCLVIFRSQSLFANVFLSSLLMLGLDIIMEQNVEKLGFWFWKDSSIPLQNYLAWFVISFVFGLVVRKFVILNENKVASALYITQVAFFIYCYFVI